MPTHTCILDGVASGCWKRSLSYSPSKACTTFSVTPLSPATRSKRQVKEPPQSSQEKEKKSRNPLCMPITGRLRYLFEVMAHVLSIFRLMCKPVSSSQEELLLPTPTLSPTHCDIEAPTFQRTTDRGSFRSRAGRRGRSPTQSCFPAALPSSEVRDHVACHQSSLCC